MFEEGRLRKRIISSDVYSDESEVPDDKKGVCLSCGGSGKKSMLSQALGKWVPFTCDKCGGSGKRSIDKKI